MSLGTSEVSLIELTAVYTGFLNKGIKVEPFGLRQLFLKGDDFPLINQKQILGSRVISVGAAETLIFMLHQVIDSGTGARARVADWGLAGKTGTTQNSRDAWFLGFSSEYVVGVWIGKDNNEPLNGVTGGTLPAEIWKNIMLALKPFHKEPLSITIPSLPVSSKTIPFDRNVRNMTGEGILGKIFQSFIGQP